MAAALVLASLLVVPGVFAKVKIFPAKHVRVADYKTYTIAPIRVVTRHGILEDDPEVAPVIRQAVRRELAAKGYQEVPEGGDLNLLVAGLAVRSSQLEGFLLTWGFDIYWGYGVATAAPLTRVNQQGVIIAGFVDPSTKHGVWTAYVTRALGGPGGIERHINKSVSQLFKKLPRQGH